MTSVLDASQPIGLFDSGIGGLTVAQAIVQHLPKENLIYFGDTAHLPWGDKSAATIQAHAIKITNVLLEQQCKLILIACNTASAVAYELVKEYIAGKAIVMNVIDPTIQLLNEHYAHKKVGLIGTKQTVSSNIYKKKIDQLNAGIQLQSHTTNLLASAIEEFGNHKAIDGLLEIYLAHPNLQQIDALVLACTHYPVIKENIARVYRQQLDIIDSSQAVAKAVQKELAAANLLNHHGTSAKHFYVSDYTETFAAGAKLFFNEAINLEHYPLWD